MKSRIVIALDKSLLAANMYRLMCAPLGLGVCALQDPHELVRAARRLKNIALIIVNSNAVNDRFDLLAHMINEDPRCMKAGKLLLVDERARSNGLDARCKDIPGSEVVAKPFHPDEFVALVKHMLKMER